MASSENLRINNIRQQDKVYTVDAGYKNTGYKDMPVIRILAQFTESFVFCNIDFLPDIRTFHAGYKNIPDIRTLYWKTVALNPIQIMSVIRTCS